jgi:DNA polymerase (family 10)
VRVRFQMIGGWRDKPPENTAKAKIAQTNADLKLQEADAFQRGETRRREAEAAVLEAQSLAEARAAEAHGLSYLAISDHSRRLTVAHGLDPVRLAKQCAEVEAINRRLEGIELLTGIEVDVLDDGSLDLPDGALVPLDVVIAAVHSKFDLSRAAQTRRILAALDHPKVKILAHPVGRLIGKREPYDVDMLAVIRKCKASGVALELNANPQRLDLTDAACRMAKDEGARIVINSDAHAEHEFDNLGFGIGQARRGWLERNDVINTRPLRQVRAWLAGRETG